MLEQLFAEQALVRGFAMAIIVLLLTQALKWMLVKPFTRLIKNEVVRERVDCLIVLIPFALGIVLDFFYCTYFLQTVPNMMVGITYGTGAIALYNPIAKFFGAKNVYQTEQGKKALEFIKNVASDGKIDAQDGEKVKEFLAMVGK